MRELALFAGMGGGILGGRLLGWRTVCAVEINDYCRRILMQRQDDGIFEPFPIWDDITTFDGKPWAGCVDIVTGGFPCQDISAAGKGAGIDGERSGLWREMARVIGDVRPRYVFVENSPVLTVRGLGTVLGDLAARGYDAEWGVLGAADLGAPHKRDRIWIVANARSGRFCGPESREMEQPGRTEAIGASDAMANAPGDRWQQGRAESERREGRSETVKCRPDVAHADSTGLEIREGQRSHDEQEQPSIIGTDWWSTEPDVGRVAHGVAARVDRLKAIGNGQVPRVAAAAFTALHRRLTTHH